MFYYTPASTRRLPRANIKHMLNPELIAKIKEMLNPWVLFGFAGQFVFFLRFVVQWWVSEKKKQSIVPVAFWYLSLVGTYMILIYSIKKQDIVFIAASCLNSLIYIRNLMLISKTKKKQKEESAQNAQAETTSQPQM